MPSAITSFGEKVEREQLVRVLEFNRKAEPPMFGIRLVYTL
jgi:hypothetical protein